MKINFSKKLIFVLLLILAAELVALVNRSIEELKYNDFNIPYSQPVKSFEQIYKEIPHYQKYPFGKVYGKNYKSSPIVIFGDSAAYGEGLKETDCFAYLLSEYTKKTVYNKAFSGWSVQNIYYLFKHTDLYTEITPPPKAVIIVYTPFFFRWMYAPDLSNALKYNVKNGQIKRVPDLFMKLNKSYLIAKINDAIAYRKAENFDKSFDDFSIYLSEIRNDSLKYWKNTKFFIIKLQDSSNLDNPKKWTELENQGFSVIDVKDIVGSDFTLNTKYVSSLGDLHPTKTFWVEIIPELSRKMNL